MAIITDELRTEICSLYRDGWTCGAISRRTLAHGYQVARILAEAGIRAPTKQKVLDKKQLRILRRMYLGGKPTAAIAERIGMSSQWVKHVARRLGLPIRAAGQQAVRIDQQTQAQLVRDWRRGASLGELGRAIGHAPTTARRLLEDAGEKIPVRHNTGERHAMWRGGRTMAKGGYWQVYARGNDEFASMRTKYGYILEHRLVMARSLGRPLTQRETVHHINGNKLDNRIENLQLRHGPHGKNECYRCRSCGSRDIEAVPIETH